MWVANSATLIQGQRDAVLVDTFLTVDHSRALADWVAASGKHLKTIYVTHAHGDHFFGTSLLLERFPRARVVATPGVVRGMQQQLAPQSLDGFWRARFPGQIAERLVLAEELDDNEFELEGSAQAPEALILVGASMRPASDLQPVRPLRIEISKECPWCRSS